MRTIAFRALNSFLADHTPSELSNGPLVFHSQNEEDSCSREIDKLPSDSDSDSSSSDENWILLGILRQFPRLQRLRSVPVTCDAYLRNLSWGFHHEEFHVEFPSELSAGWYVPRPLALRTWLFCRNGSVVKEFARVTEAARTSF